MLKVGIIGAGFMGSTHAAGWAHLPVQLVGIHAKDTDGAGALAAQYGGAGYADVDALINGVDVVDICAPTPHHHEYALKAAAAGKHVICEKPLARTLAQAREMLGACEKAGVKLFVGHVIRFFPEYAAAKATVERGDIGQVGVIRMTRASFHPKRDDLSHWFHDYTRSGGPMLDLMIHDFDYARWVAGDVRTVYAKSVRSQTPDARGDYAHAILTHTNGALSHIEGGWAYPPPLFRTSLEIAGSAGLIEQPVGSGAVMVTNLEEKASGGTETVAPRSPLREDPFTTELKHFHAILTGAETTPRITAQDGLAALQIALAASESAKTGKVVSIGEVQ